MVKIYKCSRNGNFMRIVCLEGCSGTGKTTQHKLLGEYYKKSSLKHLSIVEKDYEPFRTIVRKWYEKGGPRIPFTREVITEFAKARVETFSRNFSGLEKEIDFLLMDRYFYTSAVYQRGIGLKPSEILQLNLDYGAPLPNLTFLFDCDSEVCFDRAQERNKRTGKGYLFSISPEKVEEIRKVYIELTLGMKEVKIVDANKSVKDITNYLTSEINGLF